MVTINGTSFLKLDVVEQNHKGKFCQSVTATVLHIKMFNL